MMRTWTARIEIVGLGWVDASLSDYNLKRDQLKTAIREAAEWVKDGADMVSIQLYKTTKAHGTVKDEYWAVYRDRDGGIKAQR